MRWLLALVVAMCCGAELGALPWSIPGYDLGLVFNTENLLFDLESYQGGVGIRLRGDPWAYRAQLNLLVSTVSASREVDLGVGVEHHFVAERVSPFVGATLLIGTARSDAGSTSEVDVETRIGEVGAAGLAGVELYLTRYLALFVEYRLALTYDASRRIETRAGDRSVDRTRDWTLDLAIGNRSMIGIVFYVDRNRDFVLSSGRESEAIWAD